MDELRVEGGVKESFKEKLVRSRLKWARHAERTGEKKLGKRTDAQKMEGKLCEEDQECNGRMR